MRARVRAGLSFHDSDESPRRYAADLLFAMRLAHDASAFLTASGVLAPSAMMQMPLTPRRGLPPSSFIIRLVLNRSNGIPCEVCTDFSHPCAHSARA